MQLLHHLSLTLMFSRAHSSSSLLLSEQTFIVRVRLALLSPCSKWPQNVLWSIGVARRPAADHVAPPVTLYRPDGFVSGVKRLLMMN
jgi:hypothetical protein